MGSRGSLGERFRIELELGILRASSEVSGSGFSGKTTSTVLRYGLAAHFMLASTENFRTYAGPRIGFVRQTDKSESSGSELIGWIALDVAGERPASTATSGASHGAPPAAPRWPYRAWVPNIPA